MGFVFTLLVVGLAGLPAVLGPMLLEAFFRDVAALDENALLKAIGLSCGAVGYCGFVRGFWRTLHHELSHAFVAVLVGARPTSLTANEGRGNINYRLGTPLNEGRSFLIALAPYSVSPLAIPVVVAAVLGWGAGRWATVVTATLAGAAIMAPLLEFSPRQEDLRRHGVLVSVPAALWLWAGMAVSVLHAVRQLERTSDLLWPYLQAGRKAAVLVRGLL